MPLSAQAIAKRFYRLLEKAGLPHIKFHALRHVNASVMVELGVPEKEAQARGGWKTDYIFKQVYAHTFSRQRAAADQLMDAYFSSVLEGPADKSEDTSAADDAAGDC